MWNTTLGSLLALLLFAAPAFAQAPLQIVQSVKADLVAKGADLSGSCGAFSITRRVAAILHQQDPNYGLLWKDWGNQCENFAVGIIVYRDGRHWDILIDDGGQNGPAWNLEPENVEPHRWRAPVDVPNPGTPAPDPGTPPTPDYRLPTIDIAPILQKLDALQIDLARVERQLDAHEQAEKAFRESVKGQWQRIWKPLLSFTGKYLGPVIGGIVAGVYGS